MMLQISDLMEYKRITQEKSEEEKAASVVRLSYKNATINAKAAGQPPQPTAPTSKAVSKAVTPKAKAIASGPSSSSQHMSDEHDKDVNKRGAAPAEQGDEKEPGKKKAKAEHKASSSLYSRSSAITIGATINHKYGKKSVITAALAPSILPNDFDAEEDSYSWGDEEVAGSDDSLV